ncbi:MAG TPA: hypothetical protein VHD76_12555 [Bryobacteraceae bacterium]|jgi:hypothetical protein|nr:hypothetical protein [Bryobacteraceae bacterium]
MKRLLPVLALCAAIFSQTGHASKTKVSRAEISASERALNSRLSNLWPGDPYLLLGTTRGVYLDGYGAVFTAEIDLAPGPSLNPFHQFMTKQNVADNHKKMAERLPRLKTAMADMLASTASSLDTVPAGEKVVLGVTLTQYPWQDRTGIPSQVVMTGEKGKLIDAKRAGALEHAVTVEEF